MRHITAKAVISQLTPFQKKVFDHWKGKGKVQTERYLQYIAKQYHDAELILEELGKSPTRPLTPVPSTIRFNHADLLLEE